jgi:hypothetical protein
MGAKLPGQGDGGRSKKQKEGLICGNGVSRLTGGALMHRARCTQPSPSEPIIGKVALWSPSTGYTTVQLTFRRSSKMPLVSAISAPETK